MKNFLLRAFDYDAELNKEFCTTVLAHPPQEPRVHELLAHIYGAQETWLARIQNRESSVAIWPNIALDDLKQNFIANGLKWKEYLKAQKDFDQFISYQNSKGQPFHTRLDDILFHVINHGTHHRGQIASFLRSENISPPVNDYISYIRS